MCDEKGRKREELYRKKMNRGVTYLRLRMGVSFGYSLIAVIGLW